MKIDSSNGISFGKLYADKKVLNAEIKKLNPNLRNMARKALKEMDNFEYFDMYVRNDGEIRIKDNLQGGQGVTLKRTVLSPSSKLYDAINYVCEKEAMADLCWAVTGGLNAKNLETTYNKIALSGAVKAIEDFVNRK